MSKNIHQVRQSRISVVGLLAWNELPLDISYCVYLMNHLNKDLNVNSFGNGREEREGKG